MLPGYTLDSNLSIAHQSNTLIVDIISSHGIVREASHICAQRIMENQSLLNEFNSHTLFVLHITIFINLERFHHVSWCPTS